MSPIQIIQQALGHRAEELRDMLDRVSSSVIVVIDEAYAEYVNEPDYPDCISWLSEYPNLVVTRTFFKNICFGGITRWIFSFQPGHIRSDESCTTTV